MLLIKFAIISICVVLVLAPIVIYLMLKSKYNAKNARNSVQKQYPSMFRNDQADNNS